MYKAFIRSNEKRDDGFIYIIVDFVDGENKFAKEYKVTSASHNLEWLKSNLRQDIENLTIDPGLAALKTGEIDLTVIVP